MIATEKGCHRFHRLISVSITFNLLITEYSILIKICAICGYDSVELLFVIQLKIISELKNLRNLWLLLQL
jgi:hypothetical protein